MAVLADKMHLYNCESMKEFLTHKGLPEEIVSRPALSACCTLDIYHHSVREEFYLPTVQIFCKTLFENEFSSKQELLAAYAQAVAKEAQQYIDETRAPERSWTRKTFVLDALLLDGCNELCEYPPYATKYRLKNIFLPGIATLGDSLCAIDKLVFNGNFTYQRLIDALKTDFSSSAELLESIAEIKKFGNDSDNDAYTAEVAETLINAVDSCTHEKNEIIAPSFYSLERDNVWAAEIPATPNGRRAGAPISENQSPTYGCDKEGITALLCSLSKLPFAKTGAGGLNVTFSSAMPPKILEALICGYFELGGLHIGISVIDREILKDAMKHPEKYASLTVRLYGFSEYFISLPEWQQLAILNRTAY
jgi:formate C-acetyltransferase